ncbi:MAG: septum formation initiator family protein [Elusimicrobiaceae bacterium]|nr:septum formation initiator family protein [Elusimicrobiaceae bacterium]
MKKLRKYWIYIAVAATALFLATRSDFRVLILNSIELHRLKGENARLDAEYDRLAAEHKKLQDSDRYLERVARKELNMTKPGELEYRFDPPGKTDSHDNQGNSD